MSFPLQKRAVHLIRARRNVKLQKVEELRYFKPPVAGARSIHMHSPYIPGASNRNIQYRRAFQ